MWVCSECNAVEDVAYENENGEPCDSDTEGAIRVCGSCGQDSISSFDEDYGKDR